MMSQFQIPHYSNQYPIVCYSFIRGGILDFMCRCADIQRIMLCRTDAGLIDSEDLRASSRSFFIHSVTNAH